MGDLDKSDGFSESGKSIVSGNLVIIVILVILVLLVIMVILVVLVIGNFIITFVRGLVKKKRHFLGIFPNMGGKGPTNPKTFVISPSHFWHAKFILRC